MGRTKEPFLNGYWVSFWHYKNLGEHWTVCFKIINPMLHECYLTKKKITKRIQSTWLNVIIQKVTELMYNCITYNCTRSRISTHQININPWWESAVEFKDCHTAIAMTAVPSTCSENLKYSWLCGQNENILPDLDMLNELFTIWIGGGGVQWHQSNNKFKHIG